MQPITSFDQLDLGKQYTYADYLTWQFEDRVELIKGWIYKMSPVLRIHQKLSRYFLTPIDNYLEGKTCEIYNAPFDVRLTNKRQTTEHNQVTTVVQPDICVICDPTKLDDLGCLGAPDWIIEILSPSNRNLEIKEKYDLYEENSVLEYWVVNPIKKTISVYDLKEERFVLRKIYAEKGLIPVGIFDGFTIDYERIFR